MKTEKFYISNLKCSGCEATIMKSLLGIRGVTNVDISHENQCVMVEMKDNTPRAEIANKLYDLGYPEISADNDLLLKAKSYISCAIGKIRNQNKTLKKAV